MSQLVFRLGERMPADGLSQVVTESPRALISMALRGHTRRSMTMLVDAVSNTPASPR
jgi:hypothetical protein